MKDNLGQKCVNGASSSKMEQLHLIFLENESFSSFDPTSPPVPP